MSGVHKVAYSMVAGTFFWAGTVHEAARKPVPPFKVVRPVVTPLTQWKCDDQERREYTYACYKREQSSLIRQIQPKTKGKL